jgi:hypothetical protein
MTYGNFKQHHKKMNIKNKKLPIAIALFLSSLLKLFAKDGVVLYKIETPDPSPSNPNTIRIDVILDTTGDGFEDTLIGLYSTRTADAIMNRNINEGSIITFDDKNHLGPGIDGYYRVLPKNIEIIDGRPAQPQQNTR